jgi:hypothetical protein
MICSYYNENELEEAKQVKDIELNKLLQDVRKKDDRYYLQEKKYTIKQGFFKKPIEKIRYTLLFNLGGIECQIINFCQDNEWSLNDRVSKSYIYTLLYGFLNGFYEGEKIKEKDFKQ